MMCKAKIGGAAAIGFAATIVTANLIVVPTAASRGTALGVSLALTPAAWVLATIFGAAAVGVLWPLERDRGTAWSLAGFGGLLLQNATFAAVTAVRLALAGTTDGAETALLWRLHQGLFALNGTFLALALLGFSLAGCGTGLIPPWLGGTGLVAAALLFGSATLTPLTGDSGPAGGLGLAGWLLWVAWLVAYGLRLLRRGRDLRAVTDGRAQ
jgi:hypothetical protein